MLENLPKFLDSLLITIVIYKRKLDDCESFQSLTKMSINTCGLHVMVYDNSPSPQMINSYEGLNIIYVHNSNNVGISKAYNLAGAYAKENKHEWLMLLDQDTLLPTSLLTTYAHKVIAFPKIQLFSPILKLKNGTIFSPCSYRFKRGFYLKSIEEGVHNLTKLSPVNSGILVKLNAFYEAGGYNEKVQLDFSDFQFIERFKKIDPRFYVVDENCIQDFSDDEVSITSQATRFSFYCEGAKNCEKDGIWDSVQYTVVVLARALKLSLKYKKGVFLKIFCNDYLS